MPSEVQVLDARRTGEGDPECLSVSSVLSLIRSMTTEAPSGPTGVAGLLASEDLGAGVVARIADDVMRARDLVDRLRRRERELSGLYSSARELAELRNPDMLLRRLVQRANQLVGTDITYVASVHPDTDILRIHDAVGSVTKAFLDVQVPPGKGLANLVARTGSAHWSSCYAQDGEVDHDDGVDTVIADEGIVSMAGVPLRAGGESFGVLVAAHRSPKEFTADEIALLSAFADHASVVLHTARLLDAAVTSAAEAERACAALTRQTESMERTAAVHAELTAAILRGGRAQEVADILGGVLRRRVTILDRHCTPYAATGDPTLEATEWWPEGVPVPVHAALEESRRSGRCVRVAGGNPDVAVAAMAGETMLGAILVDAGELGLTASDSRTIERAGQIVALLTLRQEAVADAEERVRGELVSDVLGAREVHRHELLLRARSRGIRIDDLRVPVVVSVAVEHRRAALRAVHDLVDGALAGEHDGSLAVLLPLDDAGEAAELVRARVARAVPGPVQVVSGPPGELESLTDRFELARRCGRLLIALGRTDEAATTSGFAPYLALFGPGREDLTAFINEVLGPVLAWDADRGTDLVATLLGFVEANAGPTRTARTMGLHTNTVLQRLDRISTLLGDSWRDPEPLFRISIAVRLHQLGAAL